MILIEKRQKYFHYCQTKKINLNISQTNKYYLPITVDYKSKLNFHIYFLEKYLKSKQRQLQVSRFFLKDK